MNTTVTVYQASCSGFLKDEPREMGFLVQYTAASHQEAIRMAARFLRLRCQAFDLLPGCVKVSEFTIRPIADDGALQTGNTWPFFEWKFDTSPLSCDQLCNEPNRTREV